MNEFVKSIKVIKLRTSKGRYLTAHEDQKGVCLVEPDGDGSVPENAEWRIVWIGAEKLCLKSIYGKVFTFRGGYAKQELWPVQDGAGNFYLQIMKPCRSNVREFQAKLIPDKETSCSLEATSFGVVLSIICSFTQGWTVEVVESSNELMQNQKPQPTQQPQQQQQQQHAGIWQVGQLMVFNVSDGQSGGGGFSNCNSGHNVNGSGTQTNGDVSVHTETGRQRDVSIYFSNK